MSTLLHWFTSPEWAQIVKTLLHSLWQGALIALALAVFMRRLANPVSRYRCSLTALACVVVAGITTWAVISSSDGRAASPMQNQPTAEIQTPPNFATTTDASPEDKIIVTANRTPAATSMRWTAWLALVWLAGAGMMLARAGVKVAGAELLRRSCQPLNDTSVEKLLAEARRAVGLARQVRVGVTDKLTSPAVVGVFVPILILPLSLLTTLTPEQIQFILLHELAHIRRGDYLANLFQFFAESLLFFNPAVWWISHQVRREREACCDALAIELSGAPVDYARTLAHVAENVLQPPPAAATAFSDKREPSSLIDRVQRLLVPGYRPSLRLTWRAMLAALVLGSVLLVLSATGTRMTVAAILTPEQRTEQIEKKMTEVGQKPETMSDSAEQNKEMKSSATNITDNPQGTVRFEIDLYTRFANLQKLSGLRETNSLEEQLQKLFSEAGVKPPLTNVMITKEGTLVVRGTKEQLDLVMKVVQHLMMTSHNNSRTLTNEKTEAGTLLQDGKLLWEMDKLTEAEAKLKKALELDPQNYAAAYYLSLVHEARFNVATSRRGSDAQTMVHTNLIYTSKGRQAIRNKLDRIHLDSLVFPEGGLPLSEVLRNLSEESKKRDPEKRGINFIINSGVESAPAAAPVEGVVGLPPVPAEAVDLGAISIKLNPGLTDVRLADVLDAVVKVAERPIKYSIEDYAVVFSQRGAESAQLYTRWFRVDPNTFSGGLNSVIAATFGVSGSSGGGGGQQGGGGNNGGTRSTVARVSVTGGGGGAGGTTPGGAGAGGAGGDGIRFVTSNNTMQDQQVAVRLFFTTMGVDLTPPKNLFFNDKSGVLFVRATLQDLDIIETAIQALNVTPPPANIKARFAEIMQNDNRALGFDWYLGNVLMNNGTIGAQDIVNKLDSIRLDKISYDNLPLDEVLRLLSEETKKSDPEKTGITFRMDTNFATVDVKTITVTINPPRLNARIGDILAAILKGASKPIKASIEPDGAIVFSPRKAQEEAATLSTMLFKIDTYTGFANLQKLSGLDETSSLNEQLQKLFFEAGVKPPLTNIMITKEGMLVVRGTKEQRDLVNKIVLTLNGVSTNDSRTLTNQDPNLVEAATLVQDGKVLLEMGKLDQAEAKLRKALDLDPQNNAAAYYLSLVHEARLNVATLNVATSRRGSDAQTMVHTNLIYTSKGRQAIASKLDRIHLDSIVFPEGGLPLSEVLRNLSKVSKDSDPEKRGINFIINSGVESAPAAAPVGGEGGLPPAPAPAEPLDLGAVIVKLNPGLTDVRLADVLDAITKNAEKPIKYSLEDYAVVFSLKTDADSQPLFVRKFKVDTNVFLSNLRKQTGLTSTNAEEEIKALQKLFSNAGADLQPTNKAVFYNDRNGTLFVRVTLKDLDAIESAIQKLNYAPPLISIKIKFIAVPDQGTGDLFLGTLGSNSVSSMSSPETPVPPVGNNSSNGEPLLTSGLRMRSADTTSTLTGILTPAQARQVLQALESNPNAKVIATPSVTTGNGRQAQIQIVDVMTIVKGINPQALTPPGITTTNEAEIYKMEEMRFGPVIDLIPYLSEDGYTIQLTAIPSVTEFLGYDKPTNSVTVYVNGKKQSVQPPLPHIHTQKISSSVVVFDGDTLVLGGLVSEEVSKVKNKTPILGDLPLVGRAFRSESSTTTTKSVLVFITPTLVDSMGNRIHSDEEMASVEHNVPVQTK